MYVCLCNSVTDQQLVEAAAELASEPRTEGSASFAEQVANRLGAGLGCGSCREFALDLVNRVVARQSLVVLPGRASTPTRLASARQRSAGSADHHSSTLHSGTKATLRTLEGEEVPSPGNHTPLGMAPAI